MKSRVLVVAITVLLLVGSAGCVQVPRPVSAEEAPRPAMTMADAQKLHSLLKTTVSKADRKRSAAIADDVLTGTDLDAQLSEYVKHDLYGLDVDPPTLGIKIIGVYSSVASTYPQRAVVVSTQKDEEGFKDNRLMEVWTRITAAERWRRDSSVSIEAKSLPILKSSGGIASFISGQNVGGMTTDSMKPAADAFDRPDRQHIFKKDDFLSTWHDWAKDDIKRLNNSNISLRFTGGISPTVVATKAGGAVVIGRVSMAQTAQVKTDDDGYIYWKKGYMHRQFPGHYQMTVTTYLMTVLIFVPPEGKPDIHAFTYWWTGTDAYE